MPATIVLGLSYGDEGKGAAVDYLAALLPSTLVVRWGGGAQCAHNVVTPEGVEHTFHLYGSGTLAGAPTYLGKNVLVDPFVLIGESKELGNPNLFADPDCLVTTPVHRIASEEWVRSNPFQSTGMGIYETRQMAIEHPELSIRVRDLGNEGVTRARLLGQLEFYGIGKTVEEIQFWSEQFALADQRIWKAPFWQIRKQYEYLLFEGHQGLLLNRTKFGTSSDTTPKGAMAMLDGYDDEITITGVMRFYATRHGKGPLDEFTPLDRNALPERHNQDTGYPGRFRFGWHDLQFIKQALGEYELNEVMLSHLDRFDRVGCWLDGKRIRTIEEVCKIIGKELAPVSVVAYGPTRKDRRAPKFV